MVNAYIEVMAMQWKAVAEVIGFVARQFISILGSITEMSKMMRGETKFEPVGFTKSFLGSGAAGLLGIGLSKLIPSYVDAKKVTTTNNFNISSAQSPEAVGHEVAERLRTSTNMLSEALQQHPVFAR